jgi:hypothetical protein
LDSPRFEHFDLDRGLFRIDHGDNVPALHPVARFDEPLDEGAGLHIGTQ